MDGTVDAVDRISELPPFIMHHIMSYLSVKEMTQTSTLSNKWNGLQASFPVFDFDYFYFLRICSLDNGDKSEDECLKKFKEFVDDSLLRFCKLKFCMQKFRLCIGAFHVEESSSDVDKWIGLAIENQVKEFYLEVLTNSRETIYTLPQTIFSAKLVTTLKLIRCKFEQTSDTIRFNFLRKLSLDKICISEKMLQKLTSGCPLLEDFFFYYCWGLKSLCISKADKLKVMTIYSNELESVRIVVPSLQELALNFKEAKTPRVIDFAGCPQLKKLEFGMTNLTNQEVHHFISQFPLLEYLSFYACKFLERIMISSDQLKTLRVSSCANLKALDLHTPNLVSFSYRNSPIPASPINASCPWRVEFYSKVKFDAQWCLNVREFLGESNQIEVLSISVIENVSSFKFDELRENSPSFPCNVGNLKLHIDVPPPEYGILLDGLLWICYPRTLSLQTWPGADQHKLLEWFYNGLKNRDVNCCNSHHIKCWQHYLKDIKIESFLRYEDAKLLDADNLMKLFNTDNVIDLCPMLPIGLLRFRLDWCFPLLACSNSNHLIK